MSSVITWQYEIMKEVPVGGAAEERFYGDDQSGDFTWVRFFDHSSYWFGVFKRGDSGSEIKVFVFNYKATVLANGIVYVIDMVLKEVLLIQRSKNYFQDLIADEDLAFAADFMTIHVIRNSILIKVIEGVYFDMFRFKSINQDKVNGEFYQYGGNWTDIKIDRKNLEIAGHKP